MMNQFKCKSFYSALFLSCSSTNNWPEAVNQQPGGGNHSVLCLGE